MPYTSNWTGGLDNMALVISWGENGIQVIKLVEAGGGGN